MVRRTCLLAIILMLLCGTVRAFEAGAAKVEITPELGVPLNGYGDRMGRGAVSVHDPLWVRCLYLDDGETQVYLLTSDLCLISRELRARVVELARPFATADRIILTATHTHNGPGGMNHDLAFRMVSGRYMPKLVDATAQKFVQAMNAARDGKKAASIGYGTGKQQVLSVNRRHSDGPIDEQIGVVRVDDSEGKILALVTNFAAHPTTVGDDDRYAFSADYPGYFYTEAEKLSDPGCVALFMNGAEGNQTCANPEKRSGWNRTESIGRLLALRTKEIANDIQTGAGRLRVATSTPALPPTIGASLFPAQTFLQVLEINDLLLTFFPGEPCVELGLELRSQAIARGYGDQFTVGLSNDYLGYFVPQACYGHAEYEATMNFYGPRISDWFYEEFGKLMSRGEKDAPAATDAPLPAVETVQGIAKLTLAGSAYEMGRLRGAAFAEDIRKTYDRRIVAPLRDGKGIPDTGLWAWAPGFLDLTPLALPRLSMAARPLLDGISENSFREVEGLATGAGVPFDAAWLLQSTPTVDETGGLARFYGAPMCTVFAAVDERAGSGLIVGRNLDWKHDETPVVVEYRPDSGRRYIQVGFAWNAGVFTGMNDAGVVVCAERAPDLGEPRGGVPVEFVLRSALETTDDLKKAVATIGGATHLRGYRVLVAHRSEPSAKVIEFGRWVAVREPKEGLLFGSAPDDKDLEPATRERYVRLQELLADVPAVTPQDAERILTDRPAETADPGRIWNSQTRHSVVFEPAALRLFVSVADSDGKPGPYVEFSLGEAAP